MLRVAYRPVPLLGITRTDRPVRQVELPFFDFGAFSLSVTATHKLFSMTSTSFGNGNSGTQVGTNHGPITQNYFSSGERPEAGFKPGNINWKPLSGSDRLETRQQNLDNGSPFSL